MNTGANVPLLIAGPTAVGKSRLAMLLAEALDGEIISVDSMQVYRGMDIGTAKPSIEELSRVRHHLVDIAEITESFDAAKFVRGANEAIRQIQARGRVPILCGGTGLYFKALLDGLGEAPPADQKLRAELEAMPRSELLRELADRDPTTFAKIDRDNPRRVIRAIEVIRLTGKPFSMQKSPWQTPTTERARLFFGLSRPAGELKRRIDRRVDEMFQRGLVRETEALLEKGLARNPTAMQALGYRQVVEHLEGMRPLPEAVQLVKIRTRQFAKRQMTWFRRQLRMDWIALDETRSEEAVAEQIQSACLAR